MPVYSRQTKQAVLCEIERGRPIRDIAAEFGIAYETVRKWSIHVRRRNNPYADAEQFGHELTPAENRRRLNRLRATESAGKNKGKGRGQVVGEAPGTGRGRDRRVAWEGAA